MQTYTSVVVGHTDLHESDRIYRLLTAERGRLDVIGRGARSSRKRFGGALELGNRVRVQIARPDARLPTLGEVELLRTVDRARQSIERIALLGYGCELVSRLAGEGTPEPKLTRLLVTWLELLELPAEPTVAARLALEAKALTFAGLMPSLSRCAVCGEALTAPACVAFEVGAVHARCGVGQPIEPQTLALLERLRRTPLFDCTDALEPLWVLGDLARHHIGAELGSRALVQELGL